MLPLATGRNFVKDQPTKYQSILKLKKFRDDIVHTKKVAEMTSYGVIGKAGLDFNYSFLILEVRDFINFHIPSLVEQCDCGKDF